jgi:hypothetical protein
MDRVSVFGIDPVDQPPVGLEPLLGFPSALHINKQLEDKYHQTAPPSKTGLSPPPILKKLLRLPAAVRHDQHIGGHVGNDRDVYGMQKV